MSEGTCTTGTAAQPAPAAAMRELLAASWLVEHRLAQMGLPFGPAWSCVKHGKLTTSTDVNKALRFARREDAEAFATTEHDPMFPNAVVAAEHMWPSPATPEPQDGDSTQDGGAS